MTGPAWAAFAALSVIWGFPYFFIKVALNDLSPACIVWGRVTLAALVLVPLAWQRGALRGVWSRIGAVSAFATAEIIAPFLLIAIGERWISSSLTAILMATVPLVVVVLARWFVPAERPSFRRLTGLGIGLAGVLALLGVDVAGRPLEVLGASCVLVATIGYAVGPLVAQRYLVGLDPLGTAAVSLSMSAAALTIPAALTMPSQIPSPTALGSVAVLGLACTALALVLFLFLISEAGASRAAVITYLNPAIAVLLGVSVLGEHLGGGSIAGLVMILLGSWLATGRDATSNAVRSASIERPRFDAGPERRSR